MKHSEITINDSFEIYCSYIAKIYYNILHGHAKMLQKKGTFESVTESYKHCVADFMQAVSSEYSTFITMIKDLHANFQEFAKYRTSTLNEFVELILACFIPKEYLDSLNNSQRDAFLNDVFKKTMYKFSILVTTVEALPKIIDNRNIENITYFKKEFIRILEIERGHIHTAFLREIRGIKESDAVPRHTADGMRKQLKKLSAENKELRIRLAALEELLRNKRYEDPSNGSMRDNSGYNGSMNDNSRYSNSIHSTPHTDRSLHSNNMNDHSSYYSHPSTRNNNSMHSAQSVHSGHSVPNMHNKHSAHNEHNTYNEHTAHSGGHNEHKTHNVHKVHSEHNIEDIHNNSSNKTNDNDNNHSMHKSHSKHNDIPNKKHNNENDGEFKIKKVVESKEYLKMNQNNDNNNLGHDNDRNFGDNMDNTENKKREFTTIKNNKPMKNIFDGPSSSDDSGGDDSDSS